MSVKRLEDIPGFNIDRVAAAAGDDPDVLRLENLDTDVPPPAAAIEATREAIGTDDANSWLPFTGRDDLKDAVAAYIERRGGPRYDGRREIVITGGEGEAMLDALFCLTDPGDGVILTDPTYAGMLNRVRLVGAVPQLVPLVVVDGAWRLDLDALRSSITDRTRVIFLNNPSFPSGWAANDTELEAIATACGEHDLWLLYFASFEGVLFDGRTVVHPAALPGMRDRTVTVSAPSHEQRMIAWRVGWVVAPRAASVAGKAGDARPEDGGAASVAGKAGDARPEDGGAASVAGKAGDARPEDGGELVNDVSRVHIYNGLVPSGFAQIGTRVALGAPPEDLAEANAEWQRRRDETLRQLAGLPAFRPHGGWSLLLDVAALGLDCEDVSARLLEEKVAATPMRGWGGEVADRHVRFVFSNEPVERLALLGERVHRALATARDTAS